MRHRVAAKHFNRDSNQRQLMFKMMVTNLIEHGSTTTTRAKAREIKRWADKLIHKAQTDSIASRRELHKFFGKRDVVNTLVERIAPAFTDRVSGFTRIETATLRRGDNSDMVTLSLVTLPTKIGLKSGLEHAEIKPKKKPVVVKPVAKVVKTDKSESKAKPAKVAAKKPVKKTK